MAPDAPVTPLGRPPAFGLRHARCLFHPLREAAAKCPHCGGTFCRECVTDEDGKLACPPCLRRVMHPPAPALSVGRGLRQAIAGAVALACLMALFVALMHWRANSTKVHLNFGNTASPAQSGQHDE